MIGPIYLFFLIKIHIVGDCDKVDDLAVTRKTRR